MRRAALFALICPACLVGHDGPPTRGSGAKKAEWTPGAEVPGWEDYACELPEGANVVVTELPDQYRARGVFNNLSAGPDLDWWLVAVDSTNFGHEGEPPSGLSVPWISINTASVGEYEVVERGQGDYVNWVTGTNSFTGFGQIVLGAWPEYDWFDPYGPLSGKVCLSRVRPDEFRGALVIEGGTTTPFPVQFYPNGYVVMPFDILFPAHAAVSADAPYELPPSGEVPLLGYGTLSYEDAWPWDLITDDDVRTRLHDAYIPWNDL